MTTDNRDISSTRILHAPRERVWQVWTDPHHIAQWWGPNGFTNTIEEMTVQPGGVWRFVMHGPDGKDYPNRIRYQEVVEPERLVYLHDDDSDEEGIHFHVTVTFEEEAEGKTKLTMTMLFATAEERQKVIDEYGALDGQKQTLDKLEQHLANL